MATTSPYIFFILYAVFAVFFLQKLSLILQAIGFSLICYFAVFVVQQNYEFVMKDINYHTKIGKKLEKEEVMILKVIGEIIKNFE